MARRLDDLRMDGITLIRAKVNWDTGRYRRRMLNMAEQKYEQDYEEVIARGDVPDPTAIAEAALAHAEGFFVVGEIPAPEVIGPGEDAE